MQVEISTFQQAGFTVPAQKFAGSFFQGFHGSPIGERRKGLSLHMNAEIISINVEMTGLFTAEVKQLTH